MIINVINVTDITTDITAGVREDSNSKLKFC